MSFKGTSVPMSICCLIWKALDNGSMHSGWDKHGAKRRGEREREKESRTVEGTKQQVQATPLVILVSTHVLTRLGRKAFPRLHVS